jgi:hypothetical protein
MVSTLLYEARMEDVMKELWSRLGPMVLAASVKDVLADHAIGTDTQLAWQARLTALKSRHCEGVVAAGDNYRALGARAGFRATSVAKARQAYLTALFRARSDGSLASVLITAERFAALGDREVVEQCIRVAQKVAAQSRDPYAQEHLRAFTERWAASAQGIDDRELTP